MIPFADLKAQYRALEQEIHSRINRVMEHGQFIMGPEVLELEQKLEDFTGANYCITVASGTEALLISLMALGIKTGDEVITTPFSFIATAEVIVLLGAVPIFCDVDPITCNIDPKKIEAKVTKKTKAIIPVSLYGQVADMDEINALASKYGLAVIEDAAQSFGAEYRGKKSCNLSTIGCTSFFPSKPLGCFGDGGAIFTNDFNIASICKEIRVHGQKERYIHQRVGVGGRMDTIQCAILLAKLERFEWEISQRQRLAHRYDLLLSACEDLAPVSCRPDRLSVYAQYTVEAKNREFVQSRLKSSGIPCAIHYPIPINEQAAYKDFCCPDCTPIARQKSQQVISLPMSADLTFGDQDKVVAALVG